MYAIVESQGKQYRVEKGQTLLVDRLSAKEGAKVELRPIALSDKKMIAGKDAEKVKVEAKVVGHERGKKIRVFKYRPKKGYRRRAGHRSELTRLEVTEIKAQQRKPATASKSSTSGGAGKPAARKTTARKTPAKKTQAKKGSADGS
jgi:large subunit ribosomal protein L21